MSGMPQQTRAGTYFDVLAAVFISLLVQIMISLFAAGIPVLAPAIAAERGWNATVIAFYPIVRLRHGFLISFQIPGLLFRMGGMGLSLAMCRDRRRRDVAFAAAVRRQPQHWRRLRSGAGLAR